MTEGKFWLFCSQKQTIEDEYSNSATFEGEILFELETMEELKILLKILKASHNDIQPRRLHPAYYGSPPLVSWNVQGQEYKPGEKSQ